MAVKSTWLPDVEKLRTGCDFPSVSLLDKMRAAIMHNFDEDGSPRVRSITVRLWGKKSWVVITWDLHTGEVTSREEEDRGLARSPRRSNRTDVHSSGERADTKGRYIGLDRGDDPRPQRDGRA